ncbi:TPA: hypothetical protein ACUY62_000537 [Legionella pneumophila]|nr:hypothetical protein [Legionella pneumophila]
MGRKKSPGLFKRGDYWHIDKAVFGCIDYSCENIAPQSSVRV